MLYKSLKATYSFIYLKSVGSYLVQQILQHCTDLKETKWSSISFPDEEVSCMVPVRPTGPLREEK